MFSISELVLAADGIAPATIALEVEAGGFGARASPAPEGSGSKSEAVSVGCGFEPHPAAISQNEDAATATLQLITLARRIALQSCIEHARRRGIKSFYGFVFCSGHILLALNMPSLLNQASSARSSALGRVSNS